MAVTVTVPPLQFIVPADTLSVSNGEMVMMTELAASVHGPAGSSVVNVSVTVPFALSFAPGVYVVVKLFALAKLPSPELLQVAVLAPPLMVPERLAAAVLQIVWLLPALTAAGAFTATTADDCDEQL